ncbi:MAG: ABC-F family ATP-binding cassette domain-containing protein, partial [Owenweeksia sp.]
NQVTQAITRYERALENPEDTKAYQKAFDDMDRFQAWDFEVQVKQVLGKLGLQEQNRLVDKLSGGQRKRVALARTLISAPDILILDEPTNHLDVEMIEWLEEYLSQPSITLFMVTHDRYFLENVCNNIFELEDQTFYQHPGNFSAFLERKAERQEISATNTDKARNLMRKELEWIRRQPKARGTKSKARIDAFHDLKDKASSRAKDEKLELDIKMTRLGSKILELHRLRKAYGDLKIVDGFDYTFKRRERVGIIGANGVGKSTFLKLLTGEEEPTGGKIITGETIQFGFYTQKGIQLDEDKRVIDVIKDIAEYIPIGKKGRNITASQMLERFLFEGDHQYTFVSKLSGGERRRLYLLTVLMENPNFLILDEPTNDLDILTLNVL